MHIEHGKVAHALEVMDQVIDKRERIAILIYDGIESMVVLDKSDD
jgi:hypothetical protein